MKSLQEKQDAIIFDFEEMGDNFAKYTHLLGFACQLPKMRPADKVDSNVLQECKSSVWLDIRVINGLFYFTADSDVMIIKGFLYLLQLVLCGQQAREVAEAEIDFLQRINMTETFSDERQNDLRVIIRVLQERAKLIPPSRTSLRRKKVTKQTSLCLNM